MTDELGVGPRFVNGRIGGEDSTYRGGLSSPSASPSRGNMMVQLVQILDDELSI
ncbi:hypothetical protein ACFZDJ_13295 [Streptomyces sp. NPDC007896]|uniref:hypothetical protein n=1 Tax=Streptomyces sp. NPDC007896 TaxID=3364784 RepID=UPI0036DFB249